MYIVVVLGNPGEEYARPRHNTGRTAGNYVATRIQTGAKFIFPDTFMNKSGLAVAKVVKSKKAAERLIVIYADIDLPLGTLKVSYRRSSGGHRGVESIIRTIKTKDFIRIRIGISPTTPSGKIKKPKGEKAVLNFILGKFKPSEEVILKKVLKITSEIIHTIISEGKEKAMNKFN